MPTETLIHIVPEKAEIMVERKENGIVARKSVTPEAVAKCFLQSKSEADIHHTGLLPAGCLCVLSNARVTWYFIICPEQYADITYCGTEYPAFPLPKLVFAVRYLQEEHKVTSCKLCVIPKSHIELDMPTFHYPFSNVNSSDGSVCMGNNTLPLYPDPTRLSTLPGYILRLPNNNDHYFSLHNKPNLEYRELLVLLRDKEPSYYYSDILIPNGRTLKDFISWR